MLHEPSAACFESLVSDLALAIGPTNSRIAVDRVRAASNELWACWMGEHVPPRWGDVGLATTDPVQAAYRDANATLSALLGWWILWPPRNLNREHLPSEALPTYERKLGEIAHWIRAGLASRSAAAA